MRGVIPFIVSEVDGDLNYREREKKNKRMGMESYPGFLFIKEHQGKEVLHEWLPHLRRICSIIMNSTLFPTFDLSFQGNRTVK